MVKFGVISNRNDRKGLVTIQFVKPEACGKCNTCGYGAHSGEITIPSESRVGEWVRVEFPETRFVQATALVYILPLLGLFLGLFLGWQLGEGADLWTVIGAFSGLIVSLSVLYLIDRRVSKKPEWTPRITAVYQEKPTGEDLECGLS